MGPRFIFLDGLRGVAATAVVLLHANVIFGGELRISAYLAVDFFFCLSGFVVAHAYDRKLDAGMGFRAFMTSRFKRLYPMLLMGLALGVAAGMLAGRSASELTYRFALGAAMVPIVWTGVLAYPINFPMWSLFFEFAASAGYALERRRLPMRLAILAVAACGLVLGLLIVLADGASFGVGGKSFAAGLVRVAYPFGLGVIFARLALWKRLPPVKAAPLVVVLAVLLFMPAHSALFDLAAAVFVLPAIVPLAATVGPSRADAAWSYLGRLSYPLYLVHVPVMEGVKGIAGVGVAPALLAAALSLVVAHVALVTYDEPVRRRLSQKTRRAPSLA